MCPHTTICVLILLTTHAAGLPSEVVSQIRDIIIHMVLQTDMSHHFAALKEFRSLAEAKLDSCDLWKACVCVCVCVCACVCLCVCLCLCKYILICGNGQDSTQTLMNLALHASDISSQAKKQTLAVLWSI